MMNCNLDLCLAQPAAISVEQSAVEVVYNYDATIPRQRKEDAAAGYQNRLTIFYNGKVCLCDVTQFQAKAIIWQAKKQAQDRKTEYNFLHLLEANSSNSSLQSPSSSPSPSSSCFTSGVPMTKSLEQFLQKRKNRISAAAAPY